jgi:hypothetical protein
MVKKYIRKIMNWAMSDDHAKIQCEPASGYQKGTLVSNSSVGDRNGGMNFTVYLATGGKVIQFATYDPARDRHQSSLYVITDKEDLGEELGQIITKESLCR